MLTILVPSVFDVAPTAAYFALGLVFSMLPDLDGLKELLSFGSVDAGEHGDHRDGLHYPFVWVVIGAIIFHFNVVVGALFILSVLAHFLNDSWGTGWGVEWLWPINNRSYKFFSRNDVDADVKFQSLLTSWDQQSKNEIAQRLGNRDWLKYHYGRVTVISGIEYGTFVLSLVILAAYLAL
jgi:hypothetical protein